MTNYDRIPKITQEAMRVWIEYGLMPGSFLEAVLCNDLVGAMTRADDANRAAIYEIVSWMQNRAPMLCWGTPALVGRWAEEKRVEREARKVAGVQA